MTIDRARFNGSARINHKGHFKSASRPVTAREPGHVLGSIDELAKRVNDAGIRFGMAELEMVSSLLVRIDHLTDPKEKMLAVTEAKNTLEYVSRFAAVIQFPESLIGEVQDRMRHLRERVDQLSALYCKSSPLMRAALKSSRR